MASIKQIEVLDYIKKFIAQHGYSPTVREIAAGLSFKSPSSVHDYLKKLVSCGVITVNKGKSRTIELLVQNEYIKENVTIAKIPILDKYLDAVIKEYLDIPVYMLNEYEIKNLYAFKTATSIYIININLLRENKPSVVQKDDNFFFEEKPSSKSKVFGNVISEFKVY